MGWFLAAFAFLGFLVGNLIGMTAASVTTSLLGLLFAFVGGSVIAFTHKLTEEERRLAVRAIAALSLSCLLGLYCGIVVTEYQLLSPQSEASASTAGSPSTKRARVSRFEKKKYVRASLVDKWSKIDWQYRQGSIATAEEAYAQLLELIRQHISESNKIGARYRQGSVSADEACAELMKLIGEGQEEHRDEPR